MSIYQTTRWGPSREHYSDETAKIFFCQMSGHNEDTAERYLVGESFSGETAGQSY